MMLFQSRVDGGFLFWVQWCWASDQLPVSARFTNSEKQHECLFKIILSYFNLWSFTWQFQYCVRLVQPLKYCDGETPNSVKLILLMPFVSIEQLWVTFQQNNFLIGKIPSILRWPQDTVNSNIYKLYRASHSDFLLPLAISIFNEREESKGFYWPVDCHNKEVTSTLYLLGAHSQNAGTFNLQRLYHRHYKYSQETLLIPPFYLY